MIRRLLTSFGSSLVLALALAACASTTDKKSVEKPPVPPMQDEAARAPVDSHLEDVKKSAAEQLECPIDQVNVVCTRRDTEGECVAVKATGCEKTYEYQFGDT